MKPRKTLDYNIVSDINDAIPIYDAENQKDLERLRVDSEMKNELIFEKDKPPPVYVFKSSDDYGFGVVAKKTIKAGEKIGSYLGVYSNKKQLTDLEQAYAFRVSENMTVLAHEVGSVARFINHSRTVDNVECRVEQLPNGLHSLHCFAIKYIPKGGQLLLNYQASYEFKKESYICVYQNAMKRSELLKTYKNFYGPNLLALTDRLKIIFEINEYKGTHLILPYLYEENIHRKQHKNLPILLGTLDNNHLIVHEKQPYITILMLACAMKDHFKIKNILDSKVDIFAKTDKDITALAIASKVSCDKEDFSLFIPLLKMLRENSNQSQFQKYVHENVKNKGLLDFINDKYVFNKNKSILKSPNNFQPEISSELNKNKSSSLVKKRKKKVSFLEPERYKKSKKQKLNKKKIESVDLTRDKDILLDDMIEKKESDAAFINDHISSQKIYAIYDFFRSKQKEEEMKHLKNKSNGIFAIYDLCRARQKAEYKTYNKNLFFTKNNKNKQNNVPELFNPKIPSYFVFNPSSGIVIPQARRTFNDINTFLKKTHSLK